MDEPTIIINGVQLNSAQSMTVRVALTQFDFDLYEDGCGTDQHGMEITALYKQRMRELYKLMGL